MPKWTTIPAVAAFAVYAQFAMAATDEPAKAPSTPTEKAKAEQNRKKPLQRCDQLADKAQQECLQKARQRVLEARRKREAGDKGGAERAKSRSATPDGAKDAPSK